MRIIKALDRNQRDAFLLIACRCNRLGPALLRHEDLTSNVNHAQFPIAIAPYCKFGPCSTGTRSQPDPQAAIWIKISGPGDDRSLISSLPVAQNLQIALGGGDIG